MGAKIKQNMKKIGTKFRQNCEKNEKKSKPD